MRVTFSVEGDIHEYEGVEDAECREMNGDWCVKIDGRVEYVGDVQPELRMQAEE